MNVAYDGLNSAELTAANERLEQEIAERKQVEKMLRRRNRELSLLNRLGQEFAITLDWQQVAERLLEEATEITRAEVASLWLLDEEQDGWLICRAASYPGQRCSPTGLRLRPGQGIVGWVVQHNEGVLLPNVLDDPRFFPGIDDQTGFHTVSLLAVPLWVRGRVIGVLEVTNKLEENGSEKRFAGFDQDDLMLTETLAASAAVALDNAWLVERQRQYVAELEARNEELDTFAHTVAHDLKNPLAKTVGFSAVLEKEHVTMPEQEMGRYLRVIAQNGRKMSNIIDELLLLASVRKTEDVDVEPLDMASIVGEALGRLVDSIKESRAEIVWPDTWPTALGYGPWVEEVWANYLSNAFKYGGRPPQVELGATEQTDGTVLLWVRDNGPGLTAEEQARLFRSLERLDQVRAKGHGLGLSIVRRIVNKLGGQVGVESEVGEGSIFFFTLPAGTS